MKTVIIIIIYIQKQIKCNYHAFFLNKIGKKKRNLKYKYLKMVMEHKHIISLFC